MFVSQSLKEEATFVKRKRWESCRTHFKISFCTVLIWKVMHCQWVKGKIELHLKYKLNLFCSSASWEVDGRKMDVDWRWASSSYLLPCKLSNFQYGCVVQQLVGGRRLSTSAVKVSWSELLRTPWVKRCVPFVFIWPNCLASAFRLKGQREVEGRAKTEHI